VQIGERQHAFAARTPQMHHRAERRERDAHVRRVRRDASRRGAQDRVVAVEAVDRVATLAGRTLVAA
jgi:hypothetical protein